MRKPLLGWKTRSKGANTINPFKQVKVSVPLDVAIAFKQACATKNVSMAAELTNFMSKFADFKQLKCNPDINYNTRQKRRAAIKAVIIQLELVKSFEERYMDNIPVNLQGSSVFDVAEQLVASLEEAIEILDSY